MTGIPDAVNAAQELASEVTPVPVQFKHTTSAEDVIARLNWGEPALTIIDVRDRESFIDEHITGAALIQLDDLVAQVQQMAELNRDLYVYGSSEEDTNNAVNQLDQAGFKRVSILAGGLSAWKAAHGPTEGRNA